MPNSYVRLFQSYLSKLQSFTVHSLAPKAFLALMVGVTINSFATNQTLHTYTHKHDILVEQQIEDAFLSNIPRTYQRL